VALCFSGEQAASRAYCQARQRQAGWNPRPEMHLLLCFSCHCGNVQPALCRGDRLVPLVTGCRGQRGCAGEGRAVGVRDPSLGWCSCWKRCYKCSREEMTVYGRWKTVIVVFFQLSRSAFCISQAIFNLRVGKQSLWIAALPCTCECFDYFCCDNILLKYLEN